MTDRTRRWIGHGLFALWGVTIVAMIAAGEKLPGLTGLAVIVTVKLVA